MAKAHRKKKDPEKVRRDLLESAALIVIEKGFANMTVQAVAEAAGVTKGAFFHHFPTKQNLIDEVCADILRSVDELVDSYIAVTTQQYGIFTRAYVNVHIERTKDASVWASLSVPLVSDPTLRSLWNTWLAERLERHKATDSDPELALVRYAVDGIWLDDLMHDCTRSAEERQYLKTQLLALIDRKTHS